MPAHPPLPGPVLCVGAAHWDVIARADGPMARGADVPGHVTRRPGGVALNVALALVAGGVPAAILAAIGRDDAGDALVAAAEAAGVDCTAALRGADATDCYVAIEAGGELVGGVADCRGLEAAAPELVAALHAVLPRSGPIVLDGNLPPLAFAAMAEGLPPGSDVFLVAASPAKAAQLGMFVAAVRPSLVVNSAEAEAILGARFDSAAPAAQALLALGARRALVTDGPRPAALAVAGAFATMPPSDLAPISVTGAGDAMLAGLIAAEAFGDSAPDSLLAAALRAAAAHVSREAP